MINSMIERDLGHGRVQSTIEEPQSRKSGKVLKAEAMEEHSVLI